MQCACEISDNVVINICGLHMRLIRDASAKALAVVVAEAVKVECEACAKIANGEASALNGPRGLSVAYRIRDAIRNRT